LSLFTFLTVFIFATFFKIKNATEIAYKH